MMDAAATGKKIALVLPDLRAGGAERVAIHLMRHFLAAGHRVEFVLMHKEGELLAEVPSDVPVVDLGAGRIRNAFGSLIRYFQRARPDAAQVSMWPLTVAAVLARALARSPARLVISDHIALSKQYGDKPIVKAALRASTRLFYPLADARVIVADAAADDLARLSGLKRESFEVIYNPVVPNVSHTTSEVETMWRGADGRIINAGSLKPQKNHALLIRSFARMRLKRRAKLMIVGAGPMERDLRNLAASLRLADDIVFAGFHANPWPYYASADLFVLSSDYEGYPLVLIEAMMSGLGVVATDCESGPREILDNGRFGRLVPVGDEAALAEAMLEELTAPDRAALLQKRAAQLSGPDTADRYLDLLLGIPS
jgi:glycosyltransferase involved in cell wall biosynthesis